MGLPTLTEPERLYWLCAILPLLWWLAQPPRPRRVLWTAHPAQWKLAQAALRRRPPRFRALRWILLCLAAVAAVFAAARPEQLAGEGPWRLVAVVDASASTGARTNPQEPTPFERAVQRVRAAGVEVPEHVAFEVAFVRDGAVERRSGPAARKLAAAGQPAGALPTDLRALAEAAATDGTVVWVLTDGQLPAAAAPPDVAFTRSGSTGDNTAVAHAELEDRWPLEDLVLRARLVAFSLAPVRGTLRVRGAVQVEVEQEVSLRPDEPFEVEIPLLRRAEGGRLLVEWRGERDALAADDVYAFELPPLPRARIGFQEDEDGAGYARKAAAALAEVTGGAAVAAKPGETVGFLLVEGGTGAAPKDGGPLLAFGLAPERAEVWPNPVVVDWDRTDPLLLGLDLSELEVAVALRGALPDGKPLLTAELPGGTTAPLAVLVEGRNGNAVHFAFRLQDSNLPLLPAFPQLLLRAFERTQPGEHRIAAAGPPFPLGESDLRRCDESPDRALPPFATPRQDLAAWFVLAAVCCLALRFGVR